MMVIGKTEHPEFADKCNWTKLSDEDGACLQHDRPQFADKRPSAREE